MGFGGMNIWQLLIILVIVVLLFGTKKLKGIGTDLGSAIKGFKKAMSDDEVEKNKELDAIKSADSEALKATEAHTEKVTEK